MKILIADDLLDTRKLFALAFHLEGYTTVVAENGVEAVEAVKQQPFDVLIIDVEMPVMNGLEAIQHIRQLPHGKAVPIILGTAYDYNEATALQAGANLLVRKPIMMRDLVDLVKQLHPSA